MTRHPASPLTAPSPEERKFTSSFFGQNFLQFTVHKMLITLGLGYSIASVRVKNLIVLLDLDVN
jgi:hypothetical protein